MPSPSIHPIINNHPDWANCDHVPSATAIAAGLSSSSTPTFLIHTSGTGILCYADQARQTYGTSSTKIYNDWDDISEVTSLPDKAWHRNVDKIILAANGSNVKTAIVCPPTIYGPGRGPGNTYSDQWYLVGSTSFYNALSHFLTKADGKGYDGAETRISGRRGTE